MWIGYVVKFGKCIGIVSGVVLYCIFYFLYYRLFVVEFGEIYCFDKNCFLVNNGVKGVVSSNVICFIIEYN